MGKERSPLRLGSSDLTSSLCTVQIVGRTLCLPESSSIASVWFFAFLRKLLLARCRRDQTCSWIVTGHSMLVKAISKLRARPRALRDHMCRHPPVMRMEHGGEVKAVRHQGI